MANHKPQPQNGKPSEVEKIKENSRYLRGSIQEELQDPITGSVSEESKQLLKFHGSYMQDDRDLRDERRRQKLEPAYQFMVRVRAPGGVATPQQWMEMDDIAHQYANGTLKLTTRQSFQMHGILKWNLKKHIHAINDALMDTLAACGDVNRNVMCHPNPDQSEVHRQVYEWSKKLSETLSPQTQAYHEIWLDHEKVVDSRDTDDTEPMYGPVYLPRKFKIGIAVPPSNDVDVFSQDLGLIAIVQDGQLQGFNVAVGGGMGMTHGNTDTYPQIARMIGFCKPDQIIELAKTVIMIQRDYGNRSNRKNARLKYTIDARGLDWLQNELQEHLGWALEESYPYQFEHNGDRYGWVKGRNGQWHLTLFILSGRVKDTQEYPLMTGLREIAKVHTGDFRLTPNQNLMIANVDPEQKQTIDELVETYGLRDGRHDSALRRNAMSCVAFPTCGLAMAESERYLPALLDKLESLLAEAGLEEEEIVTRVTGCPNGCARPALAEIALVGKAPGKYNLYLGGAFTGERLNKLYRENIGEEEILAELRPLLHAYASERQEGEHFGDYLIRAGYVEKVTSGLDFHQTRTADVR